MKKLIILLSLGLTVSMSAQKTSVTAKEQTSVQKTEVPSLVLNNFTKEFPTAEATWTRDGENFKAEFINIETRVPQVIVYDKEGAVVRRESQLDNIPQPESTEQPAEKSPPRKSAKQGK
jgi:hypothetical protein